MTATPPSQQCFRTQKQITKDKSNATNAGWNMVSYPMDETIRGRWGHFNIEYNIYDEKSYECVICKHRSSYRDKTHNHIREEHGLRKMLEYLADELGLEHESRIDRFSEVQRRLDQRDWAYHLTEVVKQVPPSEPEPEGGQYYGLDASPDYMG